MTKDIRKYMKKYNMYQRMKNQTETPARKLIVNEIPEKPWIYLTVDLITKFVRIENSRLYLFLFLFYLSFILDLGLGVSMISQLSHIMSHKSQPHNHVTHGRK